MIAPARDRRSLSRGRVRQFDSAHGPGRSASGAHGLMVEIHPDPGAALSDGPQALTFDMFETLMRSLERSGDREGGKG